MAPIKRKAVTDERPSKKAKPADPKEKQPDKKVEKTAAKDRKPRRTSGEGEDKPAPKAKSILLQEDRAFPRGGGGVLTPLEHKQIKAQAEEDALFEDEQGGEQADADADLLDDTEAANRKKSKKARRSGEDLIKSAEGSGVRISGVSYKDLVVGSTVLGRVTAITGRDIALALPNNLTGYAPITAISEKLNSRIERLLQDEGKQDAESDEDEDIDLKQIFYLGQWLRATVTSTGTDAGEGLKSKKHIELSLEPGQVNGSLSEDSFSTNATVQASVRSVEDHGVVMDLGLSDPSVKGFVSKKELGAAFPLSTLQEGQVMLCLITGKASNGKVLKLCTDPNRFSVTSLEPKLPLVTDLPTIDAFLPGTAVDILVTESGPRGLVGKIMGMLDVTADFFHSGSYSIEDMSKKYKLGSKTKGRIIFALPQDDGSRRVGISLLGHVLGLVPPPSKLPVNTTAKLKSESIELDQPLQLSSIVETAKVTRVLSDRGVFLELSSDQKKKQQTLAFAHISQLSDKHVDSLSASSGPFKPESTHKARIIAYNPIDNVYYVSLKESTLDQAFLRLEDLPVGGVVKGTIDKLILGGPKGVTGVLVKLSDNISGLVPEMHLSDAQLQHPERKFREGFPVKARILSVDLEKRHVRLTLKKSIVDDDTQIWKDFAGLEPGMESKGTIINLLKNGAAVQFFGAVRAWLPVAEMSETFIEKPELHFRLGQTVRVRIVSVNPETHEMKVTCKDSTAFGAEQQQDWELISGGTIAEGTVSEKTAESLSLDLDNGLKGIIKIGHLNDRSSTQVEKELKRIRVGQKLSNLLVLDKLERSKVLLLTNKPAMVEDAKAGNLIRSFRDVKEGQKVHAFVRNITAEAVYAEFANGVVALISKTQLLPDMLSQPEYGLRKDQTITAWVISTDPVKERFWLSMREQAALGAQTNKVAASSDRITNPVDTKISSMSDFTLGKVTKARVASVKATQINVRLADNVQGRIDVSETFDSWEEISDKAAPLQQFKQNDVIEVKILGIHDARNHRFLPISHRQGKVPVFELSAKKSRIQDGDESLLSLDAVESGSSHLAFVNNHGDNCVWVNLSPSVRGRVALMDLSDDVGQLQNVENRFRVGCALRVTVKAVDLSTSRLDLTARQTDSSGPLTLKDLSPGMVLPARVTKSSERSVNVQISDSVHGLVPLMELSDDYDQANPAKHNKNDIVRVCVTAIDAPNKRIFLSLRPSKVLSSSLPVKDPQITDATQLKPGDTVRGFVKHVAEKGVFVSLGNQIDALVRISDLSDQFVKDWKSIYEIDQLVKGRVMIVDPITKQVQLSLKKSHVDGNYKPPLTINDLAAGTIVTGKVRKVEDFGAFVDIDNTHPRLSGLCHRSEVASRRVEDVRKLYSAGDVVKAIVLSVDTENRKISLGLKASYFNDIDEDDDEDVSEAESDDDVEMADGGVKLDSEDEDTTGGVDLEDVQDFESEDDAADADEMDVDDVAPRKGGLKTSGFDWSGDAVNGDAAYASESEHETTKSKKKKRKPEIKQDLTGDLDKYGPKSVSDFERQLLGQPNNSGLWIQYMAFQLELSEIQKAREIAQRALRMMNMRETEEKGNIWIALLNLEVEYGDDDTVEEVFKEACQVQDSLEMHEKLASIYIDSGKHDKAEAIFERMIGNKAFRANSDIWLNYASFLFDKRNAAEQARALLPKAHKSVPTTDSRLLAAKFAALEFTTASGDIERGRTLFENLMDTYPKWSSGWDMWVDIEKSRIAKADTEEVKKEARETTRKMFERIAGGKFKKRRAKFVFKKWLEFEEKEGSGKQAERVKALAKEYAEKLEARGEEDEE